MAVKPKSEVTTTPVKTEVEETYEEGRLKEESRTMKVTSNSPASMRVTNKTAYVTGDKYNYLAASEQGVTIRGKTHLMAPSSSVRRSAFFVEQNDLLQMIPSTIVTPIPMRVMVPPMASVGYLKDMLELMKAFVG